MRETPNPKYRTAEFRGDLRSRARIFWGTVVAIALLWVLLIVGAPTAHAFGGHAISESLYGFFGYACHQDPARSFHVFGEKLAVCSRCFGVYFGLFGGLLAYPLLRPMDETRPLPRVWLFAAMVPMAIDWSLGYFRILENTHFSRVVTGLILGIACAVFIVPALIELAELGLNRSLAKSKKAAG
ncbi:MAG: DUF2085 domain-containing protein [Acidobacteriota bacterium]|nr:MAG: DUF2085 domain-containing protein [Acidobacteriota bacterium]